jgi:hypothetical protein
MEWSDTQGLSSAALGAPSTVGGTEDNCTWEKVQALPQWLKDARTKALEAEKKKGR